MIEIRQIDNDSIIIKSNKIFGKNIELSMDDMERIRRGYMMLFAKQQVTSELQKRVMQGEFSEMILDDEDFIDAVASKYYDSIIGITLESQVNSSLFDEAISAVKANAVEIPIEGG